jgi:hypothetical protein
MIPKRILLVEDDSEQIEAERQAIAKIFPDAEIIEYRSGLSLVLAAKDDQIPFCDLAVIDRMLQWQTVDEMGSSVGHGTKVKPPEPRLRGTYVASTLQKIENRPRLVIFLSILADENGTEVPGMKTICVRKDATLDDFTKTLLLLREEQTKK